MKAHVRAWRYRKVFNRQELARLQEVRATRRWREFGLFDYCRLEFARYLRQTGRISEELEVKQ